MRWKSSPTSFWVAALIVAVGLRSGWSAQPPSAQEQAAYQAAVQTMIDAVNATRADNALPALTPIVELCTAARLDSEVYLAGGTPNFAATPGAAGYLGTPLAHIPGTLAGYTNYNPASFIPAVANDATIQSILLDADATEIGVGIAVKLDKLASKLVWVVDTGRQTLPGTPSGTDGIETTSGRGLPNLTKNEEILDGRLRGDSTTGFTLSFFSPAEETAYRASKASFAKKASKIKGAVGKPLKLNVPFGLGYVVQKFKYKGKLPPGVKLKKRPTVFGGFTGIPTKPGVYKLKLTGKLRGAIEGVTLLPPIKLKFIISG